MSEWASHLSFEIRESHVDCDDFCSLAGDENFVRGRLPDRDANIDALS